MTTELLRAMTVKIIKHSIGESIIAGLPQIDAGVLFLTKLNGFTIWIEQELSKQTGIEIQFF